MNGERLPPAASAPLAGGLLAALALAARCHGSDGRGDPRVLTLSPNADLTRSSLVQSRARGPIHLRITQGYGSMPAFSHKLELGDVDLLVDYVLELEAPSRAR